VRVIFPLALVGKRTLPVAIAIVLPCVLAACGGGSNHALKPANVVRGPLFRFQAPAGWKAATTSLGVAAARTTARNAAGDARVSVTSFSLVKPYNPKLFTAAAKELDGVAAQLAKQSHSTLSESKTVIVDGRKIRAYRLTVHPANGQPFDERIGFFLLGKSEYQLLCRAPVGSGDPDGACALLYATFKAEP
jgi:hypothetical protein